MFLIPSGYVQNFLKIINSLWSNVAGHTLWRCSRISNNHRNRDIILSVNLVPYDFKIELLDFYLVKL